MELSCLNTIDCQQGAVRAVRFNGKHKVIGYVYPLKKTIFSGRILLHDLRLRQKT